MTFYAIKSKTTGKYWCDDLDAWMPISTALFLGNKLSAQRYIDFFGIENAKPVPVKIEELPEEAESEVKNEK